MSKNFCFIITDAVSFNVLYEGQLEYLVNNGCKLTLICGGSDLQIERLKARGIGNVINYGLVRQPNIFLDLLSLLKITKHLLFNRYDLVVSTTPKALLLGSVAAFLTQQSRRVSFFQGRVYENFKGLKRMFYVFLDRIVVTCSQETIFVSDSLMDEFIKDIPSALKKGIVIGGGSGNGVCPNKFSANSVSESAISKIRYELNIKDTDFIILSVGRICKDKGIEEIIKVANLVNIHKSNIRFILVGAVDDETFRHLPGLINKDSITYVDFVRDIVPYFKLADLHLFLTHREGFGNVAIEAAAMDVPTLGFDVVGVRDSVSEGVSGLRFTFGDTDSVASAILEFICDPESIKDKFKNCRQWAIKNFSQENVWRDYESYYSDSNYK